MNGSPKVGSGLKLRVALALAALSALQLPICARVSAQTSSPAKRSSTPSPATPTKQPSAQSANAATDALDPLLAQAQQALDSHDYNGAIPLLEKLAAARPTDSLPHFELGYAYSELKRNEDAAREYRRSLELNPSLAAAHLNLGLVLLESDPAGALESFRHAATLLPDTGQPHYLAGRALERESKLPDALEEYRTAVQLAPKDLPMRFALARALFTAGHDADAESEFRAAAALPGDTAPVQLGLAEVLVHEKKLPEASDTFAAYLAKKPADHEARFEHAVTLENLDHLDDALSELDAVEKDSAPTAEALKLRGSIYLQQKKWGEAAATLQKASAVLPQDAEVFGWLGRAQIELHKYPDAASSLRHALSLDPTPIAVIRSLGEADYLSGQYAATLLTMVQIEKRDTLRPMDFFIRAICNEKLGQKAEAEAAYQQFLTQDHNANPDQEWQAQQRVKVLSRELQGK